MSVMPVLESFNQAKNGKWVPITAKSSSLLEVRNQLTPGDAYRQKLLALGKEGRELEKLAMRWRDEKQLHNLVKLQALFRGEVKTMPDIFSKSGIMLQALHCGRLL